jgi:hypothetical protein
LEEKLKFFIGGGALLDIDLKRFFYAIGMPMFQGVRTKRSHALFFSNGLARHKTWLVGLFGNTAGTEKSAIMTELNFRVFKKAKL